LIVRVFLFDLVNWLSSINISVSFLF
jgi:hypothetical protein